MGCYDSDEHDGCIGRLVTDGTTWCGSGICFFDEVNPASLALLAVDDFIATLPSPEPEFSPPGDMTLVNFDTWMWVDNVPEDGSIGRPGSRREPVP